MGTDALRFVEFVLWVAVASVVVVVAFGFLGFLVGDDLVTAKYALFLVGTLLFGLGSFAIQPTPTYREQKRVTLDRLGETRFDAFIVDLPPLRGDHLPFDQRISRNTKLFVTSLVVLGTSLVMEFWFGVRV